MAEALGIAASVAGILQLTITIIDTTVQYCSGVSNANKNMRNLLREMITLKSILSRLQDDVAMNPDIVKAFGSTSFATREELKSADGPKPTTGFSLVEDCRKTLTEIRSKLEKGTSSGKSHFRPKNLLWPFSEKEVEKKIAGIRQYCSNFQALLAIDSLVLVAKISADTAAARKEQTLWHESEEEEKMLRWLSSLEFNYKHADVKSKRHEGTGLWLLADNVFSDWQRASSSNCKFLWCPGNPGVGKTVLASLVIDYIAETAHPSRTAIAYIYCNYEDRAAQTAPELVGSICQQLLTYAATRPAALQAAYKKAQNGRTPLTLEEHVRLLKNVVELFSDVYIVVDAVDELDVGPTNSRKLVLQSLSRLTHHSVHVFITSRPHIEDVGKILASASRLDIVAHEDDIRSFLTEQISSNEDIEEMLDGDDEFREQIISTIISKANKQFLLPALHVHRLCDCTCKAEIEEALDDMIMTLDDAYHGAMKRIEGQPKPRRSLAQNVLMLLSCSMRSMRVKELHEAIAIQPETDEISKGSLRPERFLTEVCVGLVSIDAASQTIRLVHFTVQEFLEKYPKYFEDGDAGDTQGRVPARVMASKCLTYLQFAAFEDGPCDNDSALAARLSRHAFYHYAALHWGDHARGAETFVIDSALNLVSQQSTPTYLSASIQARCMTLAIAHGTTSVMASGYSQDYPRDVTGLYVAATFGLTLLARKLLEEGASVDFKTSYGETALHEAAKHKAQINTPRGFPRGFPRPEEELVAVDSHHYETHHFDHAEQKQISEPATETQDGAKLELALAQAAKDHNFEAVSSLLKSGASAHALDKRGRTALHWAVFNDLEDVVMTLLDHGAKVNTLDGSDRAQRTPLLEAARKPMSSTRIMRMLLERGADPNLQGTQWTGNYTALHEAANQGDCAKAALLLEFGANARILDRDGREAIDLAVSKKNTRLIQILGGAKRGNGETALHLAAANGHLDVVRLLLTSGADKEARTSIGETTLHWAASKGQQRLLHIASAKGNADAVQLLLDKDVDINTLSTGDTTPLYAAAFAGSKSVVELLLRKGADVNARGKEGATPLIGAAGEGNTAIVSILLENNSDFEAHDGYDGKTALHRATQSDSVEVIELLLQKGADVESRDDDQNTPLRLISSVPDPRMTAADGSGGLLEYILKAGARTEAVDIWGETPLQRACFKGEIRNVHILIHYDADPVRDDPTRWNECNGGWKFLQRLVASEGEAVGKQILLDIRGWPAIVQAALVGNLEIVQLLLDHGVGEAVRQHGLDPSKLVSIAKYKKESSRRKKLAGIALVVEGGWTPIEIKAE